MNLENNKIVAAILLGGLIAMLSGAFAKIFYGSDVSHGEEKKRGYFVEVAEANNSNSKKEEIDIFSLIANASVEDGKKVAKKCVACHSFDKGGANKVGPNLYGVLGNKVAQADGFQYSKAFYEYQAAAKGWDYENLWKFLNNPKKYISGTKMAFAGVKKPQQLADLLVYLRSANDNPPPLPEPKKVVEEVLEEAAQEVVAEVTEAVEQK